jgi:hypothetical protein
VSHERQADGPADQAGILEDDLMVRRTTATSIDDMHKLSPAGGRARSLLPVITRRIGLPAYNRP